MWLDFSSCVRSRLSSSVWSASVLARCVRQLVGSSLPCEWHGVTRVGLFALSSVLCLIEESCKFTAAAASVAALVSWKHGLLAAAASVGLLAFVVCYQFPVDILGSRFASV